MKRKLQISSSEDSLAGTSSTIEIVQQVDATNYKQAIKQSRHDGVRVIDEQIQEPSISEITSEKSSDNQLRDRDRKRLYNGVYLTKVDCLDECSNLRALSLFELINRINPIASIHFNFCIDPVWVLKDLKDYNPFSQYPRRCRQGPVSFVVGQSQVGNLKMATAQFSNVSVFGAPLPFQFGTHHTKLSLFETEIAMHIVVSTANLVPEDWALKTQAFYHCRAPFAIVSGEKKGENKADQVKPNSKYSSAFLEDLLDYFNRAYRKGTQVHKALEYWLDRIIGGCADFSQVRDRIIGSCPGRFFKAKAELDHFGHLKLRRVLSEKFTPNELASHKIKVCQFSSIGSLGPRPDSWLCDEFLSSLSGTRGLNLNSSSLKLIYPSVENVRNSLEGYIAGFSLPYTSKTHNKQLYLEKFLHQWKSDNLSRTNAMPHAKSYCALDERNVPQWLLITSANLSKSAWGSLEKGGQQVFMRSYELGVLLCAKDHPIEDPESLELVLPFDVPATRYGPKDKPFQVDLRYSGQPDTNGKCCSVDYRSEEISSESEDG